MILLKRLEPNLTYTPKDCNHQKIDVRSGPPFHVFKLLLIESIFSPRPNRELYFQFIWKSLRPNRGDDVHSTSGTIWNAHRRNFQSLVVQEESQTGKR